MVQVSVVATLYRTASFLDEFYRRITAQVSQLTDAYEIVLVNDGSPDASLELAVALHQRDARVKVIDLSRNFGHHKAMMTGLAHACGQRVFLIDSDLEEAPELLGEFSRALDQSRADVVFGVQKSRKGGLFERWSGDLFFKVFNALSDHPLPANLSTVRLMTRRYVDGLLAHRESEMIIAGLWVITGVFYVGLGIMLLSGTAATYLIMRRLFFGELLAGWPSLIVSVWLLGGMTLASIGIVGIYVAKVFIETKQRPYTIVRALYDRSPSHHSG
jgi:putative glycosyltransferase